MAYLLLGCFFFGHTKYKGGTQMNNTNKKARKECYILAFLAIIISFAGWLMETILFYFKYGSFHDRGFLSLPFCPIYGITLLLILLLLGTPRHGGIILHRVPMSGLRMILYFLLASLIPALIEFITGETIGKISGRVLWDYSSLEMNIGRYACLEIALLWGVLILFVMMLFDIAKKTLSRMPYDFLKRLSIVLIAAISCDFAVNIAISLF